MLKLFLSAALLLSVCQLCAQTDTAKKSAEPEMTFTRVEYESSFPGGDKAWQRFLQQHLTYPKKAVRKNIQGEVVLQFIVYEDGTVHNIEAISGPEILRKSAIEALRKTPNWIPAHQSGRRVKSYKKQPIVFRLPG